MRQLIATISRTVTRLEELCLAWGMIAIAVLTIGNVLMRTLVGESLLFAMELTQFLIVMITFVGIGYAASQGRHIRMTAFYDAMPQRWQKAVMLGITGTTSLLLLLLTYLALDYILGTVRPLGSVSPVLQVPRYIVYLFAPLGFFLGAIQYALALAKNLMEPDVYLSFTKKDEYDEAPPADI